MHKSTTMTTTTVQYVSIIAQFVLVVLYVNNIKNWPWPVPMIIYGRGEGRGGEVR